MEPLDLVFRLLHEKIEVPSLRKTLNSESDYEFLKLLINDIHTLKTTCLCYLSSLSISKTRILVTQSFTPEMRILCGHGMLGDHQRTFHA